MNKWLNLNNKKLIAISAIVLAVLILSAIFGASYAASYYYKKGVEAYSQNSFAAAKSNLTTSLIFDSKNYRAYFLLGKIALGVPAPKTSDYYPQADYKEAVKHYEKAISLGLEEKSWRWYGIVLDDMGNAYWNLNELDKAREKYSEILSKFPESSFWARYFIAWHDFNYLNKPEEAIEMLSPAPDLARSDNNRFHLFKIHALLALISFYFEDYANAQKYAELVIENGDSQNKNWEIQIAHTLLAVNYGRQKKFTLAESEIKKADDLAGLTSAFNCFLGAAFAAGKSYSKAISVAEKANKTAEDYTNSVCLRVLAVSYLAKGDKIKAKQYMEEYLSFTEKFAEKNIFVMRIRQQFEGELFKLK